jgi:hypothetical protein
MIADLIEALKPDNCSPCLHSGYYSTDGFGL